VDVSKIDASVELFGQRFASPIFLCPVGGHRMFHTDGEVATARAASAKHALQVLSTQTSIAVEDVAAARGGGLWYQLYMPSSWDDTEKMVRRVEAAGCPVLVWTIDLLGGRNLETATRAQRTDTRQCVACHATATGGRRASVMFSGLSGTRFNPSNATWDWVGRLKKMTSMKVLIKGVETGEDARLAREHGADGILVSNHGGRAAETLRSTIDIVPEVVDAVSNQIPVLVDGGVRRGSDAFKALAYGARAVGIGRPYTWGLAAFGQAGVERVLDILNAELNLTMRQCGTPTVAQITRAHIRRG
jgi:isopentenyl diphosphate isomerase/L-lactate dehydrogenase-like FMN-dependent dehydrogenase